MDGSSSVLRRKLIELADEALIAGDELTAKAFIEFAYSLFSNEDILEIDRPLITFEQIE